MLAPTVVIVLPFSPQGFLVCSALFISLTAIGATHLIYVFNHNLWSLVLMQKSEDGGVVCKLNHVQRSMIKTVVKHSVLGAMSLISLAFCAVLVTFGTFIESFALGVVATYVGSLLVMNSALAIYLGFSTNVKLYFKLCAPCNNCTARCYSDYALEHGDEAEYVLMQ